jgi:hypothetical protein
MSKVFDDAFGMPHIERAMTNTEKNRLEQDRRALARFVAGESSEADRGTLVYLGWIESKGFGRWVLTDIGTKALENTK